MLPALRLRFILGVRRAFLLGADFKMDTRRRYHFSQSRSRSSNRGNNSTYKKLNRWFVQLRPHFEAADMRVLNCNRDSALDAFDFIEFETALAQVYEVWGRIDVAAEQTYGLYDRKKPATGQK